MKNYNKKESSMHQQNITIDSLKKCDIEATIKLYAISLQDNQTGFIQNINVRDNIQNMIKELRSNNGDIYVLKLNEQVVGMGALKKVDDTLVELCKLHLCPNLKGNGLGKKLALALIDFAKNKNYTKINLHVTKTQEAAIGLYDKLGFYEYKPSKVYKMEHQGEKLKFDTLYMERNIENLLLICA
jgi:ribosomal protein S18 acetylase RimI-like enzyme